MFLFQHVRWNKWELLAALQALSVYLIMRLDEGQRDNNKLDFLLVAAVAVGLAPCPFFLAEL